MINCKVQLEIQNEQAICNEDDYILEEYEYEYHLWQTVYYVYKNFFGEYKIRESRIGAFVYTDIPSYKLDNGWIVGVYDIFDNIDEAIDRCEKLNKLKLVKNY